MSQFDYLHTAGYEKYVEEILARGLGDTACRLDPLSKVLGTEANAMHPKNDSGSELVRNWDVLNKALEEHGALFKGTRVELPSISEFEDQGVVDFELLLETYEQFLSVGMQPQILITPNFYGDEEYYENLCEDNGLVIHEVDDYLAQIAKLDENLDVQRDFLYIDNASPLYIDSPVSWTVSIADIDLTNKRTTTIGGGFGKKMFYSEYIILQLLLKRRGDTMLDREINSNTQTHNIVQETKDHYFIFSINYDGNVLNIFKFEKIDVLNSGSRKIVRNTATAPAIGLLS